MSARPWPDSRNTRREHLLDHDRIVLAEQDQDEFDRRLSEAVNEIKAKLDRVLWACIGVVLTAAGATMVGAINLVYHH